MRYTAGKGLAVFIVIKQKNEYFCKKTIILVNPAASFEQSALLFSSVPLKY